MSRDGLGVHVRSMIIMLQRHRRFRITGHSKLRLDLHRENWCKVHLSFHFTTICIHTPVPKLKSDSHFHTTNWDRERSSRRTCQEASSLLEFEGRAAAPAQAHAQGHRLFFEAEPDQQRLDPYQTTTAKSLLHMVVRVHARSLPSRNMTRVSALDMGCRCEQQPHEIHFRAYIYTNDHRVRTSTMTRSHKRKNRT